MGVRDRQKEPNMIIPIISYDIVNNFTEESIITYLEKTYNIVTDKKIHPDPAWYGRGSINVTPEDASKIPINWEDSLSECYGELEFINEVE